MAPHHQLSEIVVLLSAAVCIVALFKMLRLSPVLGYLAAGAAIGPYGLQVVETSETTATIAEFGVIFLLFVIGLELSLERLRMLRKQVFGFGTAQVLLTGALIGSVASFMGLPAPAAIIVGGGLALSSTAIVLQVLSETNEKSSQGGRLALSVLILQDLAVIPLLVLVEVFTMEGNSVAAALGEATVKAVVGLIGIVIIGRIFFRPLFRFIASLDNAEIFSAATLLIILMSAWGSSMMGLSAALGAFMAGLLIAETEFRPQVEADITPFKSLFLGLFFMTVGMSLDWALLASHYLLIVGLVLALISCKALIIFSLSRAFGFRIGSSIRVGLLLAQGSEFAFVLFGLAVGSGLITDELGDILLVTVTVSMALTPLLAEAGNWLARKISKRDHSLKQVKEEVLDLSHHVIIAGFGRVGHTVARLLEAERIPYVALDTDGDNVAKERARGMPVHYGDDSRRLVLKALGVERAQAVIITHADTRISAKSILSIRELNPDIPVIARAKNLEQVLELEKLGANLAIAEMFETSLQMGGALLKEIGIPDPEITRIIDVFRAEDYALTRIAEE